MENLKNQERQPANAATPEKAEEKGQTPKQGKKEARPLTPEEMLKRKKMLVYPLFFLVFLGAMWLIFAPSDRAIKGGIQRGCSDAGGQGAAVG